MVFVVYGNGHASDGWCRSNGVKSGVLGGNIVKTIRLAVLLPVLLFALLVAQVPRPAHAAATGSYTSLNFPGASATNCGSWAATGLVTITAPPGFTTITITDGNGVVLAAWTANYGVGNWGGAGSTFFLAQPTKNPIRIYETIDGTVVANVAADNPCLPPSGSGVKFFDPGDDRLNRDPGQPAALYCRNQGVHVYAVNVDDSKGKLALTVTKAEIDAVINGNPAANTLIKQSSDGKFKLYYLPTTKELSFITTEVRSGKQYSFVWKSLCR
jgi:hypothetical protein